MTLWKNHTLLQKMKINKKETWIYNALPPNKDFCCNWVHATIRLPFPKQIRVAIHQVETNWGTNKICCILNIKASIPLIYVLILWDILVHLLPNKNEEICLKIRVAPIKEKMRESCLSLFGHVQEEWFDLSLGNEKRQRKT